MLTKEFREKITLNIYGKLDQENPSLSKMNLIIYLFLVSYYGTDLQKTLKVLVNSDIYCLRLIEKVFLNQF